MPAAPPTRAARRRRSVRRRRFVSIIVAVVIVAALAVGIAGFVRSLSERPQLSGASAWSTALVSTREPIPASESTTDAPPSAAAAATARTS